VTHKTKKLHHHRSRRAERELDVGNSTCIDSAFYSRRDKVLTVTFIKGGGTYQYDGVTNGEAKDSGQTITGQNPPLSVVTPIADKRRGSWIVC
jgi:hypothetical protein